MVALRWIQGHLSRWKIYVTNRVADIQRLVPEALWNHLPGQSNPADCASRGLFPNELVDHQLWWNGPPFLRSVGLQPPTPPKVLPEDCQPEQRVRAMTTTTFTGAEEHHLLKKFSSLHKLLRVTAWCRRWLPRNRFTDSGKHLDLPLSALEINEAERLWIHWSQNAHFKGELTSLLKGKDLPPRSSLTTLQPFLDEAGILRVRGRIKHSSLSFDEKHSIILALHAIFSRLLTESCHRRALHGSTQLTLSLLRQFWIPRRRSLTKQCIHRRHMRPMASGIGGTKDGRPSSPSSDPSKALPNSGRGLCRTRGLEDVTRKRP